MKSRISAVLCLILTVSAVTACGSEAEAPKTPQENTAPSVTDAETEADDDPYAVYHAVSDDLPEADYGGQDFRIVTFDYIYTQNDFDAEGETGALIPDAVYRRNRAVEERYNTHIALTVLPTDSMTGTVYRTIMANDDVYDLISDASVNTVQSALKHCYQDWNGLSGFNPDKPWWSRSCYDNLSLGGKTYVMAGSITPSFLGHYYCLLMNKRLAADLDIGDDLYAKVLDGTFSFDYFSSLIKDSWLDLNADNKKDKDDQYGLVQQIYATHPYAYSAGKPSVSVKDGVPVITMDGELWSKMIERTYALLYDSNGVLTNTDWEQHYEIFTAGRSLFLSAAFLDTYDELSDMKDDFAILPFPKWSEEQDGYFTIHDGIAPYLSVPVTASDTDFIGIVTEAMAAESYRNLTPVVYDVALKVRGARDEQSIRIIDMLAKGCVIDMGFIYNNSNGLGWSMSNLMVQKKKDFTSYYAKNEKAWQKILDNVVSAYSEQN
ncbi:MAG: hypothetical protein MJ175_06500 [Clostridia bacterium]|nr:hypothetical protein [Clostridia bacterium]